MNTIAKRVISAATALMMATTFAAMTVSADKWVKSDNGTKYQYTDGSYAASKWLTMKDGSKYYLKSDGTRATGLLSLKEADGTSNLYYFNSDGVMQTGWYRTGKNTYYFQKSGKAVQGKKIKIGSYSYKFDKNGIWNGKVYSKDGKKDVTSSVDIDKLIKVSAISDSTSSTTTNSDLGKVKKLDPNEKIPATVTIGGKKYDTSAKLYVYPEGGDYTKYVINIAGCTDKDLECLKYFQNLTSLTLYAYDESSMKYKNSNPSYNYKNSSKITNLDFLYYLPNLKSVTVENTPYLTNIDGLSVCTDLEFVEINHAPITNLDALKGLKKIKDARFSWTYLDNLNGLANCKNLKYVSCRRAYLTDISGLSNKAKLTNVSLAVNRRLKDISPLKTCTKLDTLYLTSCTAIEDWNVLKECPSLKFVSCFYTRKGTDGPTAFVKWFNSNGGRAVYSGAGTSQMDNDKPHQDDKETLYDKSWDYSNRPKSVIGDDIKCDCEQCTTGGAEDYPEWARLGMEPIK